MNFILFSIALASVYSVPMQPLDHVNIHVPEIQHHSIVQNSHQFHTQEDLKTLDNNYFNYIELETKKDEKVNEINQEFLGSPKDNLLPDDLVKHAKLPPNLESIGRELAKEEYIQFEKAIYKESNLLGFTEMLNDPLSDFASDFGRTYFQLMTKKGFTKKEALEELYDFLSIAKDEAMKNPLHKNSLDRVKHFAIIGQYIGKMSESDARNFKEQFYKNAIEHIRNPSEPKDLNSPFFMRLKGRKFILLNQIANDEFTVTYNAYDPENHNINAQIVLLRNEYIDKDVDSLIKSYQTKPDYILYSELQHAFLFSNDINGIRILHDEWKNDDFDLYEFFQIKE